MSRSEACRPCTGLPSIRMSPELMSSRPAMARSVVVLPQPEGPRNTTNSLSLTVKLTSRMTCKAPKCLSTWRSSISAMLLVLHGLGRRDMRRDVEDNDAGQRDEDAVLMQQ